MEWRGTKQQAGRAVAYFLAVRSSMLTAAQPPVVVDGDEDDGVGDDDDGEGDEEEERGVEDEVGLLPRPLVGAADEPHVHALRVPRELGVRRHVEYVQLQ